MKKTIIITAMLLFTISAFTQRTTRERARQETQKQKSETVVKRSVQSRTPSQKTKSRTPVSTDINRTSRSPVTRTTRIQESQREKNNTNRQRDINRTYENPANGNNRPGNSKARKPVNNPQGNGIDKHPRINYTPQGRDRVRQNQYNIQHYKPVNYSRVRIKYRVPGRINVYWTQGMYRDYRTMYPDFNYWYYPVGYRILTVPAYNASMHFGEVSNIYGRVNDVWYSWSTDEYFLYFGSTYPYQDFTVIISGNHARRFNRHPELFFTGRYIWVTGLVSTFDGKPELIVKRKSQVHLY